MKNQQAERTSYFYFDYESNTKLYGRNNKKKRKFIYDNDELHDDFEFSDEIRPLPSHVRKARIRGETQWRREIERLEQENALPIESPGSQPDWHWYAERGIPDSVDRAQRYMYTHHYGVVLDDEYVEKLDSEDLTLLARSTVPTTMIEIAMTSTDLKKQFIRALLRTMERNHIAGWQHTTLEQIIDSNSQWMLHMASQSEAVSEDEQTSTDTYNTWLMRYTPGVGFTTDENPTEVTYGICKGCCQYMPINAKCVSVTNGANLNNPVVPDCRIIGPRTHCYMTRRMHTELSILGRECGITPVLHHIARYLVHDANN